MYVPWPTSVIAKLETLWTKLSCSQENFKFCRQKFLVQNFTVFEQRRLILESFFLEAKTSSSCQNFLFWGQNFLPQQNFLCLDLLILSEAYIVMLKFTQCGGHKWQHFGWGPQWQSRNWINEHRGSNLLLIKSVFLSHKYHGKHVSLSKLKLHVKQLWLKQLHHHKHLIDNKGNQVTL